MLAKTTWLILAVGVAFAATARADDDRIPNPDYLAWAKFGKGSWISYSTNSTMMGNAWSLSSTQILTQTSDETATIEVKDSLLISGKKWDLPIQWQQIPARVKSTALSMGAQPVDAPKTVVGQEDATALGKTFSCRKTVVVTAQDAMTNVTTTWTSDEVPGGLLKIDSATSGAETASESTVLIAMQAK